MFLASSEVNLFLAVLLSFEVGYSMIWPMGYVLLGNNSVMGMDGGFVCFLPPVFTGAAPPSDPVPAPPPPPPPFFFFFFFFFLAVFSSEGSPVPKEQHILQSRSSIHANTQLRIAIHVAHLLKKVSCFFEFEIPRHFSGSNRF